MRIVDALPVTATDKVDKRPLRTDRVEDTDPVWHRVERSDQYVPMTAAASSGCGANFQRNGRLDLLGS